MVRNKGVVTRNTRQRAVILRHVRLARTHPTVLEVWRSVRAELPRVSLATVYRNLHRLAESGEILRLVVGKEYRFDGNRAPHLHCLCRRCGALLDAPLPVSLERKLRDAVEAKGFTPQEVKVRIKGLCAACSVGGESNGTHQ